MWFVVVLNSSWLVQKFRPSWNSHFRYECCFPFCQYSEISDTFYDLVKIMCIWDCTEENWLKHRTQSIWTHLIYIATHKQVPFQSQPPNSPLVIIVSSFCNYFSYILWLLDNYSANFKVLAAVPLRLFSVCIVP